MTTTTMGQKGKKKKKRKGGVEDDNKQDEMEEDEEEDWMDEDQDEDIGVGGQHEDGFPASAVDINGVQAAVDAEGTTRSRVIEIATVGIDDGDGNTEHQPGEGEWKGEAEDEVL